MWEIFHHLPEQKCEVNHVDFQRYGVYLVNKAMSSFEKWLKENLHYETQKYD